MRTAKSLMVILLSLSLIMGTWSCKKDSDGNTISSSMTAKIDGVSWSGSIRTATVTSGILTILGTSAIGDAISLSVRATEPGTYSLTPLDLSFESIATYTDITLTGTTVYKSWTSGKLVITAIDLNKKLVSGTFEFTGSEQILSTKTVAITNGKFTNISIISMAN